jgi:hypothetical protein
VRLSPLVPVLHDVKWDVEVILVGKGLNGGGYGLFQGTFSEFS